MEQDETTRSISILKRGGNIVDSPCGKRQPGHGPPRSHRGRLRGLLYVSQDRESSGYVKVLLYFRLQHRESGTKTGALSPPPLLFGAVDHTTSHCPTPIPALGIPFRAFNRHRRAHAHVQIAHVTGLPTCAHAQPGKARGIASSLSR